MCGGRCGQRGKGFWGRQHQLAGPQGLACLRQGLAHATPCSHAVLPTSSALACCHAHPAPHLPLCPPCAPQDVIGDQSTDCEVTWVGAEDPLFKLYTSGSTGKPKGVLHTTAGYMIGAAATFKYVFDYKPDDIYWCTADCGWITGERARVLLGLGAGRCWLGWCVEDFRRCLGLLACRSTG